ncbi:2-phospho-L-lactate guanylyltransferase [Conyzicola lurida]|uniref:2-phospho-L-lactate guanylyltransferase n=1 Tax=Conyzicola lurida TaxID=1172621 RepID=A0A841ANK4_9MICO|nr:2-phospho-L-lactate guanylyltransferase [Conyzicola lurida]
MTESHFPTSRQSARSEIERAAVEQFESRPRDTGIRRTGKPVRETHVAEPTREWIVVIPVKGTGEAKSRLGDGHPDRAALAQALALDTVAAALAAASVVLVLVVTTAEAAPAFDDLGAFVVIEEQPSGLAAAIADGLDVATDLGAPGRGVAVLLGDLPALQPAELAAALAAATAHELSMVPDADGTGTALIAAADGAVHATAFGAGSRAAHAAAGYVELAVDADSGLRRDVDTPQQLADLAPRVGRFTAEVLG